MVDCCANPGCHADFRLFNNGDLYALERPLENTEFFWVCSECAPQFDLMLEVDGRLSFRQRSDRMQARPANPDGTLRLISSSARRIAWRDTTPSDGPRTKQKFYDRAGFAN
jgi:hypothetical protein